LLEHDVHAFAVASKKYPGTHWVQVSAALQVMQRFGHFVHLPSARRYIGWHAVHAAAPVHAVQPVMDEHDEHVPLASLK
jgi:hypothetical protein